MKFENEAKEIVGLVGGEANIVSLVHCATRLRFEGWFKISKGKIRKVKLCIKSISEWRSVSSCYWT